MRPKTFIILLVVLVILGAGIWMTGTRKTTSPDSRMGEKLFTDLDTTRIQAIHIQGRTQTVNLEKKDIWEVASRYGYPADFDKITDTVRRLTAARIGSSFEATPDTRRNLGLFDPDDASMAEAAGLRIVFDDAAGQTLLDVLVGRAREAAAGTGGHYLLPGGSVTGYMVDQNFLFVGRSPVDWLNKHLLDVPAEDIEKVVCTDTRTGQTYYTLARPEPYADPVWMEAAPGDILRTARFDAAFRALIALSLDDVTPATPGGFETAPLHQSTAFANHPFLTYHLYDGTHYRIYPGAASPDNPDLYYLKIEASWQAPAEDGLTGRDLTDAEADVWAEEASALQQQADELTMRLAPWVFMIPTWKYNNFITDTAEFIEPTENAAG